MSETVRRGSFRSRGQRLSYTIHGEGDRPVVLLPGLLLPARMNTPLAVHLAARGHRVILLDVASSILEMRMRPDRLYGQIDRFLDEVWGPRMRIVKRRPAPRQAGAPGRARQRG